MMRGQGGIILFANFRAAVMDALTLAGLAAVLAAALASLLVARQVVAPVQAMQIASQRIAQGQYHERVNMPDSGNPDELGSWRSASTVWRRISSIRRTCAAN